MPSREDKRAKRPRRVLPQEERPNRFTLPSFNKSVQYRCPTCLTEVDPGNVRAEDIYGDPATGQLPTKRGMFGRQAALAEPGQVRRYLCPRDHTLPPELFRIGVMPIALLGLSQSMKTHYLAAVAYQIAHQAEFDRRLPSDRKLMFSVLAESATRLRDEFIDPLFHRRQVLVPTQAEADPRRNEPVRDPITFQARFVLADGFGSIDNERYVSLYDAPGEMFREISTQKIHAPYLAAPSGVLLFIDVASLADVRIRLHGAPANFSGMEPQIVGNAARAMREQRRRSGRLDVPVSVIVSRADLLLQAPDFAALHPYLASEPLLDEAAGAKAREFVHRYAGGVANEVTAAFGSDNVRYFFASATGRSPVDNRTFPEVQPWGCLGPLLWILAAQGFATP